MLHQNMGLTTPHGGKIRDHVLPGQNGNDDPSNGDFSPILRRFRPNWGFFQHKLTIFSPFSPLLAVLGQVFLDFVGHSKSEILAPVAFLVEIEGPEDVFDVSVQCS